MSEKDIKFPRQQLTSSVLPLLAEPHLLRPRRPRRRHHALFYVCHENGGEGYRRHLPLERPRRFVDIYHGIRHRGIA